MEITDESDNRLSFKLGTDKTCTYISENFLRFFGYTERDILGSDWEFCLPPKYRPGVRSVWKRAHEYYHCAQKFDAFGMSRFKNETGLLIYGLAGRDSIGAYWHRFRVRGTGRCWQNERVGGGA
jgi:PAS domain-containing protein